MRYLVDSAVLLRDAFLIGVFRTPALRFTAPSLAHYFLVASLPLLMFVGLDWLSVALGPRSISIAAVKNVLLALLPLSLIAWLVSRQAQLITADSFGQIFVRLILVFGLFLMASRALDLLDIGALTLRRLHLALLVWFVLCCCKALATWSGMVSVHSFNGSLIGLAWVCPLLLMSTALLGSQAKIWMQRPNPVYEPTLASESALNNQALLLNEQLASIKKHRPGVADLYFIGFAPDASEDVFKRELESIHPLMDRRFDTAGRSLRLINHSLSLATYPVATVSNLRVALRALAEKMDMQEDVLVLYTTGHGSREHDLAARFAPMRLEQLNPESLKNMLDAAGIKNRVLIISACYSGGFIDPLKDPYSMVLTASSKEKTSFGCGNDSDFTFFGKALFDEQLRRSFSFEQAFKDALPSIARRETALGVPPSDPQIAVGDAITPKLKEIAIRLQAIQPN